MQQQTHLKMFRFIDFENNSFVVTFLFSMFTIWKRFLKTRLNHVAEAFLQQRSRYLEKFIFFKKGHSQNKMKERDFKWYKFKTCLPSNLQGSRFASESVCILKLVKKSFSFFINLSPPKDLFLLKRNLYINNKSLKTHFYN